MLRQLQDFTIPTAISITFFDATFLTIANLWHFSGRDIALGVAAGAAGGLCVLGAVLLQAMRSGSAQSVAAQKAN